MTFNLQNEIDKKLRTGNMVDLIKILDRMGFDLLNVRSEALKDKQMVRVEDCFEVFGGTLQILYWYDGGDE